MTCSKSDGKSLELASSCLSSGGIAILPTDTVYGFSGIVDLKGRNAFGTDGRIRRIKGRDEGKPLIQLISSPLDISAYTDDRIPEQLLEKWPGPLTVIVNVSGKSPYADPIGTVALRCPGDPWLRAVIESVGAPIYSTSVNRSGFPVLDRIQAIEAEFGKDADLIVSDGDKTDAVPSTIVSVTDGSIKVLRQGAVTIGG